MTRAARAARVAGAAALAVAVLSSAACSSSTTTSGTGETISTPPTSSVAPVSVPATTSDTPTPTSVAPTTSSAAPRTAAASSTPPPTTTAPPVAPSTCRTVGVRVIQGGAERGAEIAALQFTNTGAASCQLGGFPTVFLLRAGQPVGSPSQPSTPTPKTLTLQPGATVESLLRDFSSCQAPLSDSARVTVPGETTTAVRPIQLRACTLRVGPLGPPA